MTTSSPHPPYLVQHLTPTGPVQDLPVEKGRRPEDYEFRILTVGRRASARSVRESLAAEAEYGRWELARTRMYLGGEKKVWLRRRIIRVASTLPPRESA